MDMYKERIPSKYELTRISALDFWLEIYVNLDERRGDTLLDAQTKVATLLSISEI